MFTTLEYLLKNNSKFNLTKILFEDTFYEYFKVYTYLHAHIRLTHCHIHAHEKHFLNRQ